MRIFFRSLLYLFPIFSVCVGIGAQEAGEYGRILSISGKTITAQFDQRDIGVGDEIEFWRVKAIVDPMTGSERGNSRTLVARGVVDEIGLGKASITVTEQLIADRLTSDDRPFATGIRKSITRKVGRIQEISADREEMTIDLGTADEISEGDEFLIQRTENIYDTQTKEITGTNKIDVGRGKVNTVQKRTSKGKVTRVEPGMQILTTDTVIFTPEATAARTRVSPEVEEQMRGEIGRLGKEVKTLRANVDSLRQELLDHRREHRLLLDDGPEPPEPPQLAGVPEIPVPSHTSELIPVRAGDPILTPYRRALEKFRAGHYMETVPEFTAIMDRAPDSPIAENCRYWIAQAHFNTGDYPAARAQFQAVIDDTRFTHKDDDAAIMLGITWFRTGKQADALAALNRFVTDYPASEYQDKARRWIARISTPHNGR